MTILKPLVDNRLRFSASSHKYWYRHEHKQQQSLTSVTTFLSKHHPFDAKAKAKELAALPHNKAAKRGMRYWLARWKEAADYGTLVHEETELYIINSERNPPKDVRAVHACNYYDDIKKRFELDKFTVHPELRIAAPELGLAGTIDLCLCFGDKVLLYDWKTNGSLAHSLPKYQDQLNVYSYILSKYYGYQVLGARIVHLQESGVKEYVVNRNFERVEQLLKEDNRL